MSFALLILLLAPLMTVPMFLLGMHAARIGTFSDPQTMRTMYLRRASLLIPVGLILKAYGVLAPQLGAEGWLGIGIGERLEDRCLRWDTYTHLRCCMLDTAVPA